VVEVPYARAMCINVTTQLLENILLSILGHFCVSRMPLPMTAPFQFKIIMSLYPWTHAGDVFRDGASNRSRAGQRSNRLFGGWCFIALSVFILLSAIQTSAASTASRGKIIAISLVKNEVDIIEAFVRHTLHFVDEIIVSDNGSIDGTRETLQKLVQAKLPIRVIVDDRFEYDQSNKMTALYRLSLRSNADFVMPLDADEFIQAKSRSALRESFKKIPSAAVGKYSWKNYVLSDVNKLQISQRFTARAKHSSYFKVVIKAPGSKEDDAVIEQGNHALRRSGKMTAQVLLEDCSIAHFPIRSKQQLSRKVVIGWLANVAHFGAKSKMNGFHWKDLYEKVISGEELKDSVLAEEAYWYGEKRENRSGHMDLVRDPPFIAPRNATLAAQESSQDVLSFVSRSWEAELLLAKKRKETSSTPKRSSVLVAVANYDFSQNADKLFRSFSRHFDTVLIDSSSKVPPVSEHLSIPNTYYPGLWNEAVGLALDRKCDWLFFIASDVMTPSMKNLVDGIKKAASRGDIGVYTPSLMSGSRSDAQRAFNNNTNALRDVPHVEGFAFLARTSLLKIQHPIPPTLSSGWGVDVIASYNARRQKLRVVADDGAVIFHPAKKKEHEIDSDDARIELFEYLHAQGMSKEQYEHLFD